MFAMDYALHFIEAVKLFSSFLQVFGSWLHSFLTHFQCLAMSFFCLFWSSSCLVSSGCSYGKESWEIDVLPPSLKIQPSLLGKVRSEELLINLISASLHWSVQHSPGLISSIILGNAMLVRANWLPLVYLILRCLFYWTPEVSSPPESFDDWSSSTNKALFLD